MRTQRGRTALAWLTLVALVLRATALVLSAGIPCVADECSYLELAETLAEGGGFQPHEGHYWPPGYIAYLAAILASGGNVLVAKAGQVILSTLLVPLTFACAISALRSWSDERRRSAALWAAALVSFDPTLIAFSHYLWSETLFLPVFLGGLLLAARSGERLRDGVSATAPASAAGALLGLACLIKAVPLYLVPLLALWLVRMTGRPGSLGPRLAAGLLLLATAGAVIAPWTVRNALVHGHLVLIETTGGKNLVRGNNPYAPTNWDLGAYRVTRAIEATGCTQSDLIERDGCLTRAALRYIASHPGQFVADAVTKLADLLNPTSFAVRHIRLGVYGDWPRPIASAAVISIALFNAALMALAVLGWGWAPASPWRSLVLLVVVYICAVHVLTFGMSRFRLPLEPLLAIGSAVAICELRSGTATAGVRGPRFAVAGALLAMLALWALRIDGLF